MEATQNFPTSLIQCQPKLEQVIQDSVDQERATKIEIKI